MRPSALTDIATILEPTASTGTVTGTATSLGPTVLLTATDTGNTAILRPITLTSIATILEPTASTGTVVGIAEILGPSPSTGMAMILGSSAAILQRSA